MPTNLVRDEIANGWRDGVTFLAHEAAKLEDLADYSTIDALRYDLLEDAREYYEAILHVEQAIGQHEDAFYQRITPDECTCMSRENEQPCPVCVRAAAESEGYDRHWSDDPKVWANDPS